jgi:hypothetical protein
MRAAMFNDILTGKASTEAKASSSPYREPATLPPTRATCVRCQQGFEVPANTVATECPSCRLAVIEQNAQHDRAEYLAAEDEARRKANRHRLFAVIGGIAVVVGLGFFKFGMRSARRDDAAKAAGYRDYDDYKAERDAVYPTDELSRRVHSLAGDMCSCKELACAREVQAKYISATRSGAPSDDQAEASIRADSIRLADCQQAIERGTPAR